jgi:Fe-S cluster assembly protein SufD
MNWLEEKKKNAFEVFSGKQMPSEREEPWRYTNISRLDIKNLEMPKGGIKLSSEKTCDGIIFCSIKTALEKYPELIKPYFTLTPSGKISDKISAMQLSVWKDGIFIYIPENSEASLKAVFDVGSYYTIIAAEKGSKLDFFEKFTGKGNSINTSVTEICAKQNSSVNFYSMQDFSQDVYDFSIKKGIVESGAEINWTVGSFGGKLSRTFIETFFSGDKSKSENISMFLGSKNQHIDITNNAYHKSKSGKNNMLSKGILKDSSSSVYRGLIKIEGSSKETDTYLASHSIILGDKAVSNPIPQLEIDTNDIVRAGHGASVGHIDENNLFYMMSRGITKKQAEELIINGFFEPLLKKIRLNEAQKEFRHVINEKMGIKNAQDND